MGVPYFSYTDGRWINNASITCSVLLTYQRLNSMYRGDIRTPHSKVQVLFCKCHFKRSLHCRSYHISVSYIALIELQNRLFSFILHVISHAQALAYAGFYLSVFILFSFDDFKFNKKLLKKQKKTRSWARLICISETILIKKKFANFVWNIILSTLKITLKIMKSVFLQ